MAKRVVLMSSLLPTQVLTNSAELASFLNETDVASAWTANATALKKTFNDAFWSEELGMYTDNATTTFVPQDGNSLAVVFNLTTPEQAQSISTGLTKNWNEFGSVSPESPDTIAPFIGSFEVRLIDDAAKLSAHVKISFILVAGSFPLGKWGTSS